MSDITTLQNELAQLETEIEAVKLIEKELGEKLQEINQQKTQLETLKIRLKKQIQRCLKTNG